MHRDKVVGLAMAILLIGIVGAFFFRPNAVEETPPQLKSPEALDNRIAEKPLTPYLTSPEFGGVTEPAPPAIAASNQQFIPTVGAPSEWELPDFLQGEAGAELPTEPFAPNSPPPDPITIPDPSVPVAATEISGISQHNAGWEVEPSPTSAPTSGPRQTASQPASQITHVVRDGDTLSELAGQYLGTSTRYLEIYEANRDMLRSPNDLRVGMKIRIPAKNSANAGAQSPSAGAQSPAANLVKSGTNTPPTTHSSLRNQSPAPQRSVDTPAVPTPAIKLPAVPTDDKGLTEPLGVPFGIEPTPAEKPADYRPFSPVRRSPFNPRRPGDRSAMLQNVDGQSVKSLSQIPPEGMPSLEDLVPFPTRDPADTGKSVKPGPPSVASDPFASNGRLAASSATQGDVDHPTSTATPGKAKPAEAPSPSRRYRVQRGDSLEIIALRVYGNRSTARHIFAANRAKIQHPDEIREGMILVLP